jgi:hypothetical protein
VREQLLLILAFLKVFAFRKRKKMNLNKKIVSKRISRLTGFLFFLTITLGSVSARSFFPTRTFCISEGYELGANSAYFPNFGITSADYSVYYRHLSFRVIGSVGEGKRENDWPLSSDTIKSGSKLLFSDFSILLGCIQQIQHGNFLTFYFGPGLSLTNYLLSNKAELIYDFLPNITWNLCISGNLKLTDLTDSHAGLALRPDIGAIFGHFDEISRPYICSRIYCNLGLSFILTKDMK